MTKNPKLYLGIYDDILKFLGEGYYSGKTTAEIAKRFEVSNRTVGALMGKLSKQDKVQVYTKGHIYLQVSPNSPNAPIGLSNSFYDLK